MSVLKRNAILSRRNENTQDQEYLQLSFPPILCTYDTAIFKHYVRKADKAIFLFVLYFPDVFPFSIIKYYLYNTKSPGNLSNLIKITLQ